MRIGVFIVLLHFALVVSAADRVVSFESIADQKRYDVLLEELRCLVCQNQSLADSHADLAQDLRDEVYKMVTAGEDDQAIRDFMVARYGDFVLYKPPIKSSTWLLWLGPVILLGVALGIVAFVARRRASTIAPLSASDRARADALLNHSEH